MFPWYKLASPSKESAHDQIQKYRTKGLKQNYDSKLTVLISVQ